jgi:preprotein translocase subunit SecA
MSDDTIGFTLTAANAEEFFIRCHKRWAVTRDERIAIMEELKKELRAIALNTRDLQRIVRNKKVMVIKSETEGWDA